MGVHESKLFAEIEQLPGSKTFFVAFCAKNNVTTSETRLAQAKAGKDFGGPQMLALLGQVDRLKKFRDRMLPLPIRFDDADAMTALVSDFESGKLSVTIGRSEEVELIRKVFQLEFVADQFLFRGIQGGDIQRTNVPGEAVPFADERTAQAAAQVIAGMGRPVRVVEAKMRVSESKLVKNLAELGFSQETETIEF